MISIPLEDNFEDVISKAQRGLGFTDEHLAERAGLTAQQVRMARAGQFDEIVVRLLARVLGLDGNALADLGKKSWRPATRELAGLASFNTPFEGMTVNSYLVWDRIANLAAAFDTGSDSDGMVEFVRSQGFRVTHLFLTHVHYDHVFDLSRLTRATGARAFVGAIEPIGGAETFQPGARFEIGSLPGGSPSNEWAFPRRHHVCRERVGASRRGRGRCVVRRVDGRRNGFLRGSAANEPRTDFHIARRHDSLSRSRAIDNGRRGESPQSVFCEILGAGSLDGHGSQSRGYTGVAAPLRGAAEIPEGLARSNWRGGPNEGIGTRSV